MLDILIDMSEGLLLFAVFCLGIYLVWRGLKDIRDGI
jgi:hypothetical protein